MRQLLEIYMKFYGGFSSYRMLVACLAGIGLHAAARANEPQDLTEIPFEQLLNLEVVTASRIPQKLSEAPTSVTVITAEDIRHFGHRTLAEIMESVRGIYVSYDRNYHYVGTRGVGRPGDFNTRLLVLIDGQRLNDVVFDQGAVGTEFPLDVDSIERVEFVAGPGSALYGSSAFFGVINVITKGIASSGTAVSAGRSSAGGKQARVHTTWRSGDLGLLLAASQYSAAGKDLYFPEFDSPSSHHGIAQGLDDLRYRRLFTKLTLRGLAAQAWYSRRLKGTPTASYGQVFNDPRSRIEDAYMGARLSYQAKLSETLEFSGSIGVSRYDYLGRYVYDQGATLNIDKGDSQTTSAELRLLSTGLRGHKLIAGAEYLWDSRRALNNYDAGSDTAHLRVDRPKHRAGVYVQDEMRLGEHVVLNTGLRLDHDAETGNIASPRAALLYKMTPELTLKGGYGEAYRSPNAYERYYATGFNYKLNPGLRPERNRTYELIAEYFPIDRFRASASVYQYRFRDLIALTTDPDDLLLYYSNVEAARTRGAELEAEWRYDHGAMLKASASFQSARDGQTREWLSNSPRRMLKLHYSAPLAGDRLRGAFEYQLTSDRRTTLDEEIGGFGLLNATLLGALPGNRLELSLGIRNLLDKRYAHVASEEHYDASSPARRLRAIGQDGRSLRMTVTARF
ncbi:TonB-dependent siderophore receptor [Massilia sp. H6]|uniref:TonB-dependent receptor plug domain-containing protein n=1 Tax=Massilia sp. H6 TaxID=2970464 RepID=UPI00216A5397|nr:TonB-dependent receptor [Massilia sp. H6]UVW30064.1 TonB-dependent receptor [Massilia sp. H6]